MIRQLPLPLPHDAAMGADDYLVTSCNRDAAAWVAKWPDWPTHGLIITGLEGTGKTHLAQLWLDKSQGELVSHQTLIDKNSADLTSKTKALALDNADALAGNADAEEKLFHLYNHIREVHGSLLLTMKRNTIQAGFTLPDLRSRLLTLPVATLLEPDDPLIEALIVKQLRDRQIDVDLNVVTYLAPRIPRDAASIRSFIETMDREALAEGRKISIGLARRLLETSCD